MPASTLPLRDAAKFLIDDPDRVLAEWLEHLTELGATRNGQADLAELKQSMASFIRLLNTALIADPDCNLQSSDWSSVLNYLEDLSRTRAIQGYTASETASFVYSIKRPLFNVVGRKDKISAEHKTEATWKVSALLDQFGMHTFNAYIAGREQIIRRQQEELLELSTPVIKVWDGVLALPMIGTLDSSRTQIVMETLLQRIVETGSELAIIDITGVPTVDTLVAQHLIKTVTAIRLMGAECIVSGIRPQIAQTIVHLGVDLQGVVTKATLADALSQAFRTMGLAVTKARQ